VILRIGGKSGISIDSVIRVIANAKMASSKDTTCSGFIFGIILGCHTKHEVITIIKNKILLKETPLFFKDKKRGW
jgi:hypothetical protein